jgi:hypothetical protein
LLLAYKNYDRLNGVFIDSLLFSAGDYSLISLNDGAIQEILNTGSLNLIRDDRIRIDLASWNERMHQIRKFEGETENLSRNYLEYLKPFFDFRRYVTDSLGDGIIPEKKQQLLSDPLLSNYLMTITGLHRSMYIRYSQEKAMLDSLYIYIDKYLGK